MEYGASNVPNNPHKYTADSNTNIQCTQHPPRPCPNLTLSHNIMCFLNKPVSTQLHVCTVLHIKNGESIFLKLPDYIKWRDFRIQFVYLVVFVLPGDFQYLCACEMINIKKRTG